MGSRRRCPACGEPLARHGCTSEPHPYKPGVVRGRCHNPKFVEAVHAHQEHDRVISVAGRLEVDEQTITVPDLVDVCPHCGRPIGATTGLGSSEARKPGPGDWCICISCGEVARYRRDGYLRKLRTGELEKGDGLDPADRARLLAERDRIRTLGRLATPRSMRE